MKQKAFYHKYVSKIGYYLGPYLIQQRGGRYSVDETCVLCLTRDITYSSSHIAIQLLCLLKIVSWLALVLLAATDGADLRTILERGQLHADRGGGEGGLCVQARGQIDFPDVYIILCTKRWRSRALKNVSARL